jgi:hypothetical protein
MTDKEIAFVLRLARAHASFSRMQFAPYMHSRIAVNYIHHIINSINWED